MPSSTFSLRLLAKRRGNEGHPRIITHTPPPRSSRFDERTPEQRMGYGALPRDAPARERLPDTPWDVYARNGGMLDG